MIDFQKNLLENSPYETLSDKELKNEFEKLKHGNIKDCINDAVLIIIEAAKRFADMSFDFDDIEILKNILNQVSLDISSEKTYRAFLIYTVLCSLQNIQLHCLFSDDYQAKRYFDKSKKFYDQINITASFNTNSNINIHIKNQIYSNNIIFSNWRRIGFDRIDVLNIEKIAQRFDLRFENAFIFDIDRIIYDHEKFTLKIKSDNLKVNEIKVKDLFGLYKNLTGVSSGLFFESKKIEKSFNIKTKTTDDSEELFQKLKQAKEKFYSHRDEKIRNLARKIETLAKNQETVIVDIDSNEDFKFLEGYLNIKKIKYNLVSPERDILNPEISSVLVPNKISIMKELLSASIEAKPGGDWEEAAKYYLNKSHVDKTSNFYREKYKKELLIQKEISEKNAKAIEDKGGIVLIFASHYTELKFEYIILKNYKNIKIKNIYFYNCPQDDVYCEYRLDKLNVFKKINTDNEILFDVFSKFLFYLRKYSINKFLAQQKGYLYYSVDETPKTQGQYINPQKIKRNDPCPCGSGKKYKNCCGR